MRRGWEHFGISECMGGGKISMPPVVGVQIFSGTTHLYELLFEILFPAFLIEVIHYF